MSVAPSQSGIPIDAKDLAKWKPDATGLLRKASIQTSRLPSLLVITPGKPTLSTETVARPITDYTTSIIDSGKKTSGDETLLAEGVHRTLSALRMGLQIGLHLSGLYSKMSGLDALMAQTKTPGARNDELTQKSTTASAIALFTAAYYISWDLARYRPEDMTPIQVQSVDLPQIALNAPRAALLNFTFWIGKRLELDDAGSSDLAFAKATMLLARRYAEDTALRKGALKYAELFTDAAYKLVGTAFSISGFSVDFSTGQTKIEFNRQKMDEIVGNDDAKHFMHRQAQRLICYDKERKDNPWRKLGGLSKIAMGHGPPGTGKSMLIAAMATLLSELCEVAGLQFIFNPLPDTVVSTFQGGSAERMTDWFKPVNDPSAIVFAPIDDAENNLQDRTMQGVSAGVREVIGVFLRNTEGAYAIDRGNAAIHIYTNIADQIDPAVRSRILERFLIEGAKTVPHFLDQNYLWWRKYNTIDGGFISLLPPSGYTYLTGQQQLHDLGQFYLNYTEPKEGAVREILARTDKIANRKSHDWFATLFVEAQRAYPLFTSRDVRNIQSAVSSRVMDFDLPTEWLEKPDVFFAQSFDRKETMIVDRMKQNMQGLQFGDIWRQEVVRYLDSFVRILDVGFERRVNEYIEQRRIAATAEERLVHRPKEAK